MNGEAFEWKNLSSGAPQGSFLGSLFFVLFINDLPDAVNNGSEIFLYVDNTKIYRKIENSMDCDKLQEDLMNLKIGWRNSCSVFILIRANT